MGRVREERLEHPPEDRRRHAGPRVAHDDLHRLRHSLIADAQIALAAPLDRLERILGQVGDDVLEQPGVAQHPHPRARRDMHMRARPRLERIGIDGRADRLMRIEPRGAHRLRILRIGHQQLDAVGGADHVRAHPLDSLPQHRQIGMVRPHRQRQPALDAAGRQGKTGQRRTQLVRHRPQCQRHPALLLLDQDLPIQPDDDQHPDNKEERQDRHLFQQGMPWKSAGGRPRQQEQRHRGRSARDQGEHGKCGAEVKEDHDGNEQGLRPHHRPGILQIQEDKREWQPHRHGERRIGRQPFAPGHPIGKQQRDEQQRTQPPQPDALIRLRKDIRPDHEIERMPDDADNAGQTGAPKPRRALAIHDDGIRYGGHQPPPHAG